MSNVCTNQNNGNILYLLTKMICSSSLSKNSTVRFFSVNLRKKSTSDNNDNNKKAALSQGNCTMQCIFAYIQWLFNCYYFTFAA